MNATPEKQPDQIQDNLNSMQKGLESLKASIEKDITLSTKQECVVLMKNIVSTMALVRSDNKEVLGIQQMLDKNPNISKDVLDKIIKEFIDIQLDYTAQKSQATTDKISDKYKKLLDQKSGLDALLSSIQPSYTIDQNPKTSSKDKVSDKKPVDGKKNSRLSEKFSWLSGQTAALFNKEEWKKDPKTNAIRAVSGLAIVGGAAWGIKKIFSMFDGSDKEKESTDKKKEESKEGMARWKKGLLAVGGLGVGWGLWKNKDKIMEWLGFKDVISFEDSFTNFSSDIKGSEMEKQFGVSPDPQYEKLDDNTYVLTTYGSSVKLDLKNKKVEGLDVTFKNYKEMLHAANIINFCTSAFRGKCSNDQPFKWSRRGGDLEVDLLKDSDNEVISGQGIPIGKILGGSTAVLTTILGLMYGGGAGGVAGLGVGAAAVGAGHLADTSDTLSRVCETLNNPDNKEKLRARLNNIPNLTAGKQSIDPGQTSYPEVNDIVNKVKDDIENTVDDNDEFNTDRGVERSLILKNLKGHNDILELTARNRTVYIKIDTDSSGKINKVSLEDCGIIFRDDGDGSNALEQAIRTGLFVSQSINDLQGKGDTAKPFEYKDGSLVSSLDKQGIYFDESWSTFDRKLSKEAIEKNMPILLQGKNMEIFVSWLNSMKSDAGQSLWNSKKGGSRHNTFLKSLS